MPASGYRGDRPYRHYNHIPSGRASIFTETVYDYETLASRLRDLAYLNAESPLTLTDMREMDEKGECRKDVFYSEEGLKQFVRYLDQGKEPLIE